MKQSLGYLYTDNRQVFYAVFFKREKKKIHQLKKHGRLKFEKIRRHSRNLSKPLLVSQNGYFSLLGL